MHGAEVDLIAEAHAEFIERARSVVAGAVKALIHDVLDARPERLEHRETPERGASDRDLVAAGEGCDERLKDHNAAAEHATNHSRRSAVNERPVDDEVDVVEAVAQDRDTSRDRDAVQSE